MHAARLCSRDAGGISETDFRPGPGVIDQKELVDGAVRFLAANYRYASIKGRASEPEFRNFSARAFDEEDKTVVSAIGNVPRP